MNDGNNAKQQIADRIKNSTTILVTVSRDPSVDELSAALALTAFLNKLKKHATAVVSGALPPAINFLEPDKTFENKVDSLRDFIIALNKEKADHLRYKVEGDVVKIFITPYRTTITSDDLDFSQGDYNVELVLALGVSSADHLDTALDAHGRILHDATVATITAGNVESSLGSIDWHDANASSVSEMLIGLTEALKGGDAQLDEQIATALLTGIVASTDRFSNNRTSSRVMTMAAQLMAAGANQQLIAARLEEASAISSPQMPQQASAQESTSRSNPDGTTNMNEGESTKLNAQNTGEEGQKSSRNRKRRKKNANGELNISHEKRGDLDEVSRLVTDERQAEAARVAEDKLQQQMQQAAPFAANMPSVADLQQDIQNANDTANSSADAIDQALAANQPINSAALPSNEIPSLPPQPQAVPTPVAAPFAQQTPSLPSIPDVPTVPPVMPTQPVMNQASVSDTAAASNDAQEPLLGGTLNATTERAAEDKRREEAKDRNKRILSHGSYIGDSQPTFDSPINSASGNNEGTVDAFGGGDPANKPKEVGFELPATAPTAKAPAIIQPLNEVQSEPQAPEPQPQPSVPSGPTLAEIDAQNRAQAGTPAYQADDAHDEARAEVEAAFNSASEGLSFEEAPAPQFSALTAPPAPAPQDVMPPLPDFSTLPELPADPQPQSQPPSDPFTQMPPLPGAPAPQDSQQSAPETPVLQAPPAQAPSPTQFRIPGQ